MKNPRAIRIAVALSLMVQSMVGACAAAQCADMRCSVVCDSTAVCDGCDRCPVAGEGELCCCCKPKPGGEQPTDCPHESLPLDSEESSTPEVVASLGICLCGLASSPIDRDQERTRATEKVEHDECGFFLNYDVLPRPPRLASASLESSPEIGLPPRFSQRLLCVWRI